MYNTTICFKCLVQLPGYWIIGLAGTPFRLSRTSKGHFGPKRSLFGSLAAQKRSNISPKCVVTMIPTQMEQPVAVGTKSGPPGPPKEAFWAQMNPVLPVFDHFLDMGGSKWAVRALYEKDVLLR